jgi:23S rRNA pseudouridine1911/1915/1917 synthase
LVRDRVVHVNDEQIGLTLAAVVKSVGWSWEQARRAIDTRRVQVDGNLCLDGNRRMKGDEVVKIYATPRAPVPTARDVRVVFRDAHLIVVEKPAGMTTLRHEQEKNWDARRKQKQPTLEECLEEILRRRTNLGADRSASGRQGRFKAGGRSSKRPKKGTSFGHPIHGRPSSDRRDASKQARQAHPNPDSEFVTQRIRVRPVHRLDRDTSGLMVFALTPAMERAMIELFKTHTIDRCYRAIVEGEPKAETIRTFLVRDRGDGLRGSWAGTERDRPADAQEAITHVRPIGVVGQDAKGRVLTEVECRLETGRTHQIRIHLSERGHRLCGERVYTHALGERARADESGAPRQALHAGILGFVHPATGEKLCFQSDWPRELRDWIDTVA